MIKISPKTSIWEKYSTDGFVQYSAPPLEYPYMGIITNVQDGFEDFNINSMDEGFNIVPPAWFIQIDFLHGPHEYSYVLWEGSALADNIGIELVTE